MPKELKRLISTMYLCKVQSVPGSQRPYLGSPIGQKISISNQETERYYQLEVYHTYSR